MKEIKSSGEYTFKEDGSKHSFEYAFPVYANIEEAIDELGDAKILAMVNQTAKEDCANNAREAQKRANGHSAERVLSPDEQEARKQERKANSALIKMLKANPEELAKLMAKLG